MLHLMIRFCHPTQHLLNQNKIFYEHPWHKWSRHGICCVADDVKASFELIFPNELKIAQSFWQVFFCTRETKLVSFDRCETEN